MENLTTEQLLTLLIGVIVLIVIVLGALVLYIILGSRQKAQRRLAEGGAVLPSPAGRLRVSLFPGTDGLQVEVGGVYYRTLAEIRGPEVKRQVVMAAMDLIRFTGVLNQDIARPASIDETYRWREDLRKGSDEELAQIQTTTPDLRTGSRTEIEEQFLSLLSEMGQAPSAPDKPGLMKALERSRRPKLPGERPRTFVDDIEDIVQRRSRVIPALNGRELHVRADSGGGVRFEFEGRDYQEVNDLPNMTARQIISDAIKEWEETA